jgi:hypothetical protein
MQRKPTGTVLYRQGKGRAADVVYAVAKWRDSTGRQQYRRLGPAWVERVPDGHWRKRKGRAGEGYLDQRAALVAMAGLIDEVERAVGEVKTNRQATFADAAAEWLEHAEHTQRMKPSTLQNYRAVLAQPGPRKRGAGDHLARIMRAFGTRAVSKITSADVERFLRRLDRDGMSGRNVNLHRQALANVFQHAMRPDTFAL